MKEAKESWANLGVYLLAILILASFSSCSGGRASTFLAGKDLGRVSLGTPSREAPAGDPGLPPHPFQGPDAATSQKLQAAFYQLPLSFIPNRGQVDGRVRFYGHSGSAGFFFTSTGVVYAFVRREGNASPEKVGRSVPAGDSGRRSGSIEDLGSREGEEGVGQGHASKGAGPGQAMIKEQARGHVVRLQFVGASPDPVIEGREELAGKVNYFIGNEPARWQRGLSTYGQVRYRELWPGIDLFYRGQGGRLKYEFVVKPGADPSQIRLAYRGIEGMNVSDAGDLILKTASGELRDSRPIAYQEIGGRRVVVEAGFRVEGRKRADPEHPLDGRAAPPTSISRFPEGSRHGVELPPGEASQGGPVPQRGRQAGPASPSFVQGFEVRGYDPAYPLILDPGLEYSTFLGGGNLDGVEAGFGFGDVRVVSDSAGNAFVTGLTSSPDFPTTAGAFDTRFNGGTLDAFVARLSGDGSTLLFSTFLGGDRPPLQISLPPGLPPGKAPPSIRATLSGREA